MIEKLFSTSIQDGLNILRTVPESNQTFGNLLFLEHRDFYTALVVGGISGGDSWGGTEASETSYLGVFSKRSFF